MIKLFMGINGAIAALQAGVIMLTSLNDETKAVIVLACTIAVALINPFLPKASEFVRRQMGLQRRG